MKPTNTIELLVGRFETIDQIDDDVFVVSPAIIDSITYDFANINFQRGVVEVGYASGPNEGQVFEFAIYATLHPIDQ